MTTAGSTTPYSQRETLPTAADIEQAYHRIKSRIVTTPLLYSPRLSSAYDCSLYLKLETLQRTGAFKARGALNKVLTLSDAQRAAGLITASAGNHAQGVAYAARELGLDALIVMPVGTPLVKVSQTQAFGASTVLFGETFDDAYEHAMALSIEQQRTFVHPFADPIVIAGQGTIGIELINNPDDVVADTIIVPVGGGGLIGGIATYVKAMRPQTRIIGVEAAASPAMMMSRSSGYPVRIAARRTLADGIAVKQVGILNYQIAERYVDELVTVDEDQIANAVLLLLEREKIVAEGAAAATVAALRSLEIAGQRVVCIISGGNIDVNVIGNIIVRGLRSEGRVARLQIRLPDKPGALLEALKIIRDFGSNILDIEHMRYASTGPFGSVDVNLTLETRGWDEVAAIRAALAEFGVLIDD